MGDFFFGKLHIIAQKGLVLNKFFLLKFANQIITKILALKEILKKKYTENWQQFYFDMTQIFRGTFFVKQKKITIWKGKI